MKVAVSIQALRSKILLRSVSRGMSAYFNGPMSADWIPNPPTQKSKIHPIWFAIAKQAINASASSISFKVNNHCLGGCLFARCAAKPAKKTKGNIKHRAAMFARTTGSSPNKSQDSAVIATTNAVFTKLSLVAPAIMISRSPAKPKSVFRLEPPCVLRAQQE